MNNRIYLYKKLLETTINNIEIEYKNSLLFCSKVKGGLFINIKFKNEIDNNIFESGNNYYLEDTHNNETRINICNTLFDENHNNLLCLEDNNL